MSPHSLPPGLSEQLERLGPYAAHTVERAARFGLKLHADEVHVEHLLATLLNEDHSAAGQTIIHAFADPETIRSEVMALCPGILVIGSKRSLPFSVLGVAAMELSREKARGLGAARIKPLHLLLAALDQLPEELAGGLLELGLSDEPQEVVQGPELVPLTGPLLRFFDADARRSLSAACHQAVRLGRDAISPAHLMMGCLESVEGGLIGLSASRAKMFLGGRDDDPSPLPDRSLPFTEELLGLLAGLPGGASTADLLAAVVAQGSPELHGLLERQKVTLTLLEHTQGAFRDPDTLEG